MTTVRRGHLDFVDEFGQEVVDRKLSAGQVLRTEDLQTRYGCTRSVAREGTRVLQALGMVSSRRNVGVVIEPSPAWNVFDRRVIHWRLAGADRGQQLLSITELRLGIEPLAAKFAAERISLLEGQRLMVLAGELLAAGNAGDLETFLAADIEFHALILRASGNEMFAHVHEAVGEVLSGRTAHGLMPERPQSKARHWHFGVADAIQRGVGAEAEELMRNIVLLAAEEMRTTLTAENNAVLAADASNG